MAVFGDCGPEVQEIAFQYGRNIGMAFQVSQFIILSHLCFHGYHYALPLKEKRATVTYELNEVVLCPVL